jgi:hypothetical protein
VTRKKELIAFCVEEAEKLAQPDGFVSVNALARRFQAQIIVRPLLVEAMLGSFTPEALAGQGSSPQWVVLIDSERYLVTAEDIRDESSASPLPVRLRNTVAHEIVHSLSFRDGEFGFSFLSSRKKGEERNAFIQRVEKETEELSPLLLVPQSVIVAQCRESELGIENLCVLRSQCGISPDVLINRLCLLSKHDPEDIRYGTCLDNIAVGRGEWINESEARLAGWPLYFHFDRGLVPNVVTAIMQRRGMPAGEMTDDSSFWLNGGSSCTAEFEDSESPYQPSYSRMKIRISIEQTDRRAGTRFLFLISKI